MYACSLRIPHYSDPTTRENTSDLLLLVARGSWCHGFSNTSNFLLITCFVAHPNVDGGAIVDNGLRVRRRGGNTCAMYKVEQVTSNML